MAAPDAKTSPSQKEVQQHPEDAPVLAEKEAKNETPQVITYESAEASEKYVLAKSLLGSGDFEQAMELIEEAIQEYRAILVSHGFESDASDLHESLGPWHYLYGTTLLYSIEESNDTQMTVGQEASEEQPQEEMSPEQQAGGGMDVEDMEIAWENLDTARQTIQLILATSDDIPKDRKTKLQLDLAQILLREGDLQRLNGRYSDAIGDYTECLLLRKELLEPFDRKVADAQYNLGLSYLSSSSELQKEENPTPENLELSQEHCQKGVELYLDCARTLCGQIASLCAEEPSAILENESGQAVAGLKTTGMDEADLATIDASQILNAWRTAVAALTPVEEDDPRLVDLKELLDEIQETIDEAEGSQHAVREAVQLKLNAQKAVVESEDGTITQIGFGQPTMAATVATVAAAAQPMMVVKKKKKRDADGAEKAESAKRAKTD